MFSNDDKITILQTTIAHLREVVANIHVDLAEAKAKIMFLEQKQKEELDDEA